MSQSQAIEETVVARKVKPVGNLLNDNDSGVDQLGYRVYAQALAKLLRDCAPPITVGIFGPWGIGKTFLLKHVQGLLRKYEQQQHYDEAKPKTKHSKCLPACKRPTEEVDGPADLVEVKPKRTRLTNCCRGCKNHAIPILGILLLILVIVGLLVAIIVTSRDIGYQHSTVVASTGSGANASGSGLKPRGKSMSFIPEIDNLTDASQPTTTATGDAGVVSGNLRLYLILFLVALTGMVFAGFCCCVANTSSKSWTRFHSHNKLVFYAAFTRLPSVAVSSADECAEPDNPYMVRYFNNEKAELRYYDPGDEGNVKITSQEVRRMPSKYIFVNYHAWQYAGSDTLWAGIVTNLSDAIEKEFGAVCARLFRMMQVERPSKSGPIKVGLRIKEDPRSLYIRFEFFGDQNWTLPQKRERILLIMKEYGVVCQCGLYRDSWWYVLFSSDKGADFAETSLKLDNFEVSRERPKNPRRPEGSVTTPDTSGNGGVRDPLVQNQSSAGDRSSQRLGESIALTEIAPARSSQRRSSANGTGARNSTASHVANATNEPSKKSNSCCSTCCCTHFNRHPKTVCCGCPFLYCSVLFIVAAIMFPVAVMILASHSELKAMKSSRNIPVEVQIFSFLPAMLGILVITLRFCWAMCHSQTERIRKALAGTKGSMGNALGFMNEVKREVMIMTQLINCVRFTHGINYKIVITIDDLDRCPYDKVKSVLEAVSILLSDRSSPFLCLIAVDSRVAVRCIEQDMGDLLQAHLTGHEYLKKIINLPFCLPEVANNAKGKYFGGIMDCADEAIVQRVRTDQDRNNQCTEDSIDAVATDETDPKDKTEGENGDITYTDGMGGARPQDERPGPSTRPVDETGDATPHERRPSAITRSVDDRFSKFLFQCRKVLNGDGEVGQFVHQHMCGNPRNMKRIFNVLSLTTHLMKSIQEQRTRLEFLSQHSRIPRKRPRSHIPRSPSILNSATTAVADFGQGDNDASDLVKWIVAADQWPYRISYILQVVEDSDLRREADLDGPKIENYWTLSKVYEDYVEPEIAQDANASSMLTLDCDPAILRSFLRGSQTLTRKRVSCLFPVTLNLDQSLRNGISRQRTAANLATTRSNSATEAAAK